jgi:hypothetical protein
MLEIARKYYWVLVLLGDALRALLARRGQPRGIDGEGGEGYHLRKTEEVVRMDATRLGANELVALGATMIEAFKWEVIYRRALAYSRRRDAAAVGWGMVANWASLQLDRAVDAERDAFLGLVGALGAGQGSGGPR